MQTDNHSPTSSSLQTSVAACRALATSHYENFPVLSFLLPRVWRDDFAVLYSFCRMADDAADERATIDHARAELCALRKVIRSDGSTIFATNSGAYEGWPFAPYVIAWVDLIHKHNLPEELFVALLDAFEQDQIKLRYETWDEVLAYCAGSANPVGRLVLHITGHANRPNHDQLFAFSDATCTALQLTNFWQDVGRDYTDRDRLYIPRDMLVEHGVTESHLVHQLNLRSADAPIKRLEKALVERTEPLFDQGKSLWPLVDPQLRPVLQLFTAGGQSILQCIRRQDFDVLQNRPRLGRFRKALLLTRAWWGAKCRTPRF